MKNWFLLTLVLAGCPKAPPAATDSETTAHPEAAAPAATPDAGASPLAGDPQHGILFGKVLLPPSTPGESTTELAGCLAQAGATEADGARFPAPAATRGGPAQPAPRITPIAGGVIVAHDLSHACCLKATVTSKLEGRELTVRETLSGTPCRCMCASTIKSAVGLSDGSYHVKLLLGEVTVMEKDVTLGASK
jgi:hypothetical protein